MDKPKYQLWPHLEPRAEDVERWQQRIKAEKESARPNWDWIRRAEQDMALAEAIAKSTGENQCEP